VQLIDSMASGSAKVLDQVLKLIDAYDLYGSVAYPKRHTQDDISDIYLLPAATRGVFVNIALQVRQIGRMWAGWHGAGMGSVASAGSLRYTAGGAFGTLSTGDGQHQQRLHGPAHVCMQLMTLDHPLPPLTLTHLSPAHSACPPAGALWPDPD
jgi:hypothetical protein